MAAIGGFSGAVDVQVGSRQRERQLAAPPSFGIHFGDHEAVGAAGKAEARQASSWTTSMPSAVHAPAPGLKADGVSLVVGIRAGGHDQAVAGLALGGRAVPS